MVMFFVKVENKKVIPQFFQKMIERGVEHGYKVNINALVWQYKNYKDIYFINFRLFPSIFIFNWFLYIIFKLSLKFRFKEKCEYIGVAKGIRLFLEME